MSSIGMVRRMVSFSNRIINVLDKVQKLSEAFETIQFLLQLVGGDMQELFQKGLDQLKQQATQDVSFGNIISIDSIKEALLTFQINAPKIMTELVCNYTNIRLLHTIQALNKSKDARFLVFMPTPSAEIVPNPLMVMNTGLKLKFNKNLQVKVALYFGAQAYRGRFFGIGSIPDQQINSKRKPHQLFRMDYHNPHPQDKNLTQQCAYWEDGNFHFHVLPKRRTINGTEF
jgi:hypothetical protein